MRCSNEQLRGAILEEVILHLLARSGYVPLSGPRADPSISIGRSGLELRGRGASHQIDAIADFRVTPPFGFPLRLLVEAKFISGKVGLPIVRNSAGVLKDVSENWVVEPGTGGLPPRQRFRYLSALFSATDFTEPAQQYAYAQDIYLVPLARSQFMQPIVHAITAVAVELFEEDTTVAHVRNHLRNGLLNSTFEAGTADQPVMPQQLASIVALCDALRYGAIAMFGGRFPTFLVAEPHLNLRTMQSTVTVRIRWLQGSWFIEDLNGSRLFSFDLPAELFRLYARSGILNRQIVAEIKGQELADFFAYHVRENDTLRIIHFQLDRDWYADVIAKIGL